MDRRWQKVRLRRDGFIALESIIGIVMLTAVAIVATIVVVKLNLENVHGRLARKAAEAAEMILEQYGGYAAQNFFAMDTAHQVNTATSVRDFLDPANTNPTLAPYAGFQVTTTVSYSANRSTCTVAATMLWQDAIGAHSAVFQKAYAERPLTAASGTAQVYVKLTGAACPGMTTMTDIITNCPGLPGVTISAAAQANPSIQVQAVTDANGLAIMYGVHLSQSAMDQVTFNARSPTPSKFTVTQGDPGFVQAYYNVNNFSLTDASPSLVMPTASVLFTNFRQTGSIKGTLTTSDTGQPLGNAGIQLISNDQVADHAFATAGSYRSCTPLFQCVARTNSNGVYEFNNVVPVGTNASLIVDPGNDLNETPWGNLLDPSDPTFVRGYLNKAPATGAWGDVSRLTPTITVPLLAKPKGDLKIQIRKGGLPFTDGQLKVMFTETTDQDEVDIDPAGALPVDLSAKANSNNGVVYLSNYVAWSDDFRNPPLNPANSHLPVIRSWILPDWYTGSGYLDGLHGLTMWTCPGTSDCTGPGNPLDVVNEDMTQGYHLTGQAVRYDPATHNTTLLTDGFIQMPVVLWFVYAVLPGPNPTSAGNIDYRGYWPAALGSYAPTCSTHFQLDMMYFGTGTLAPVYQRIIGVEQTTDPGNVAHSAALDQLEACSTPYSVPPGRRKAGEINFNICVNSFNHLVPQYIGSSGLFAATLTFPAYYLEYKSDVTCDATNFTCSMANPAQVQAFMGIAPIYQDPADPNTKYGCGNGDVVWDWFFPGQDAFYPCTLLRYKVQGYVRDSGTSQGIIGVSIYDANVSLTQVVATTDGNGHYTYNFTPHKPDFTVAVAVGSQTGGVTYGNLLPAGGTGVLSGSTATINLPDPLTPETGIQQDFTMGAISTNAGGL